MNDSLVEAEGEARLIFQLMQAAIDCRSTLTRIIEEEEKLLATNDRIFRFIMVGKWVSSGMFFFGVLVGNIPILYTSVAISIIGIATIMMLTHRIKSLRKKNKMIADEKIKILIAARNRIPVEIRNKVESDELSDLFSLTQSQLQ